jgi:acetyl-CoA carboxylase biotin carboxyl carrier protein
MSPKPKPAGSGSAVDWQEVERVLAFMDEHGLEEFEFAQGGLHIHLRKPGMGPLAHHSVGVLPNHAPAASSPAPSAPSAPSASAEPAPDKSLHTVKSPIVGTFYSSPKPDAPPFVKPGDQVKSGQVLCIIEAMKLMNEIEADVAGEVVQVLAQNGQPVEYGEPLFAIRLAGPVAK